MSKAVGNEIILKIEIRKSHLPWILMAANLVFLLITLNQITIQWSVATILWLSEVLLLVIGMLYALMKAPWFSLNQRKELDTKYQDIINADPEFYVKGPKGKPYSLKLALILLACAGGLSVLRRIVMALS